MTVTCIKNMTMIPKKELSKAVGTITFKEGERYFGSRINETWWCVEQIGITDADFNEHFTTEG